MPDDVLGALIWQATYHQRPLVNARLLRAAADVSPVARLAPNALMMAVSATQEDNGMDATKQLPPNYVRDQVVKFRTGAPLTGWVGSRLTDWKLDKLAQLPSAFLTTLLIMPRQMKAKEPLDNKNPARSIDSSGPWVCATLCIYTSLLLQTERLALSCASCVP